MTTVLAFHPRAIDPPHFAAETEADLYEGLELLGEQCDDCGGSLYSVVMHGGRWYAVCARDDNPETPEGVGCGFEYAIRPWDEEEVVFP